MRQAPERWSVEARPEVSRPEAPQRSPWPVIVGGLIATVGSIVVLGAVFTLVFGVMVAFVIAVMTITVAWAVTHPPDPVP
jgi:CBS-domain-containing membrane protein